MGGAEESNAAYTHFTGGERAPVPVQECLSQIWPAWPGAEPEADEVTGGQVDARVLGHPAYGPEQLRQDLPAARVPACRGPGSQ